MNETLLLGIVALVGYAIGSIPTAYLICVRKGINIFEFASGNMGTTNVARALGGRAALWTWIIDTLKGIIPVLIGRLAFRALFKDEPDMAQWDYLGGVVGAVAAIIGHSWSVWVLFYTGELKGGKAAATTSGTWIALSPWYLTVLIFGVVFSVLYYTRIMSLAVLATVTVGVLGMWLLVALGNAEPVLALYGLFVLVLIFYKHRENIQRMRQGNERRIGGSKEEETAP
jgi:glycerol-3-phosphate acyltransferase PlsY